MEKKDQDQTMDFEKMSLEELEEVEEVVTPSDGTAFCCD